jgi:flagellar P-ring protein FlgI
MALRACCAVPISLCTGPADNQQCAGPTLPLILSSDTKAGDLEVPSRQQSPPGQILPVPVAFPAGRTDGGAGKVPLGGVGFNNLLRILLARFSHDGTCPPEDDKAMKTEPTPIRTALPRQTAGRQVKRPDGVMRPVLRRLTVLLAGAAVIAGLTLPSLPAAAQSRIKDIADVEGVRDNQLVGYGLVVGLNRTGDTINNSPFTEQSLIGMLERMGVNVRGQTLRTRNVAAVMVTATLPPFSSQGTRIDVSVSTMGDAQNLQGGTLLVTPLMGADGEVYAVAQGAVAVSGFAAQGQGASITRGVPTAGRIAGGALVEREIDFTLNDLPYLRFSLRNPDFTTAQRMAEAVNQALGGRSARAIDPSSVLIDVPGPRKADLVSFVRDMEQLRVTPDQPARVVIDEASGIIVMGENVRISTVAIAQGNLTIKITETPQVSQPAPLSTGGQTVVVPRTDIQVDDQKDRKLAVLPAGVSLQELVQNLNALGVGPRDMISILQSIKAAGALQAEIEVM